MILGIVGSRYTNSSKYDEFVYLVRRYIYQHGGNSPESIVTGDSDAIDVMALHYANEYDIPYILYPDHDKNNRMLRDQKMMDICTHIIVMPSCTHDSPDAWDIIHLARKHQKDITILYM